MTLRRWIGAPSIALALFLAPGAITARADTRGTQDGDAAAGEAVDQVIEEYAAARLAFEEKYGAAKDDAEREKARESYPDATQWFPRLLAIAEEHPLTDGAARALVWIVQYSGGGEEQAKLAFEYLLNDYLLHPRIAPLCDVLSRRADAENEAALRRILAENPEREPQGAAAFALAKVLMQKAASGGTAEAAATMKEAEALFERVVEEYADVSNSYAKLGDLAAGELFELRNLQIGMVAPDIEGEDIDGVTFKLTDYRGKVVLLDFWGHW